jgi:SsrA-binding protein
MSKAKETEEKIKIISQNKKAFHDFEIGERFEAGIVLLGTEVKSLREGRANLKDSYARAKRNEVFIHGLHISPYTHASFDNHDPERIRKLLLHKAEIKKLIGKTQERGFSLVPLKIYFKDGKAKLEIALARGKKEYDKRESLKRKEETRELERLRKRHKIS